MASLLERFEAKVDRSGGCWLWLGTRTSTGYGQIRRGGRGTPMEYAHRVAYELSVGSSVPEGLEVDHTCFERACVRPGHLEVVTPQENHRRRRGRPRAHKVTQRCPSGHLREGNTRLNARGARICVICRREAVRRHRVRTNQGGQ